MSRKVQKTFMMPLNLAERLEEEQNQSATVAEALSNHYGMEVSEA